MSPKSGGVSLLSISGTEKEKKDRLRMVQKVPDANKMRGR